MIALARLARLYDVPVVVSTVGVDLGVNEGTHDRAFDRMIAAGARPVTAISFGAELIRNWARGDSDNLREVMRWYFPERQRLARADGHPAPPAS